MKRDEFLNADALQIAKQCLANTIDHKELIVLQYGEEHYQGLLDAIQSDIDELMKERK